MQLITKDRGPITGWAEDFKINIFYLNTKSFYVLYILYYNAWKGYMGLLQYTSNEMFSSTELVRKTEYFW